MSAKGDALESAFNKILGKIKKVDTRFSKKGYKQYMDSVARKNIPLKYQTRIAKQAAKSGLSKSQASAIAADVSRLLREAKKDVTTKMTGSKGTQGTLTRFATKKTTKEPAAGRVNARTGGDDTAAYQQEYGKGGKEKITEGGKSFPRMDEAASKGSRKRAKRVAELERQVASGSNTAEARLKSLDRKSAEAEKSRVRKSAVSRGGAKKVPAGDYMNKQTGEIITVTGKELSPKKLDGKMDDYIRNPTNNQIDIMVRNINARQTLSAEAKRNLEKLNRMKAADRSALARRLTDRKLEERARDIETRRKVNPRNNNRGGLQRKGHTDMRKGGLFYR